MSMQGKTYKNYEEFSIAFDNTPEEVLRTETYTLLKAYNRTEQQLQQYKQQIDEAREYVKSLKDSGRDCEIYYDIKKEVLSKLKERDEK